MLTQFLAILMAFLSLNLIQPRSAQANGSADAIADVVAKVGPAVVRIVTVKPAKPATDKPGMDVASASGEKNTMAIGSGFLIDPSGFVTTNKHVIEDAVAVYVATADGVRHRASIIGITSKADMALLKIDTDRPLPVVRFGDSDKMRVGDTVIAIGSPFGFDETVTAGIVSAINRDIMESPFDDYIQTDAPINHGNSGGPLFNLLGEVIGMNSVLYAPRTSAGSVGLGFAIPSNELHFVMRRLMKDGQIRAGMLPIRTQQLTWRIARAIGAPGLHGALVDSLDTGGDDMMNGQIRSGDVILAFDGQPISDPRDLARKVAQAPIGGDAFLDIFRDGARQVVHVAIQGWPEGRPPVLRETSPSSFGLQLAPASKDGVLVSAVDPTGSAADSGIQKGDVILQVQQQPVSDPDQALRVLQATRTNKRAFTALLVERHKQRTWIAIAVPE
ncbi:trypsin-like peptidase domain-containing protein [Rhodopila sp.]|uniref:trypsin-like peptidase domain-containing protein n=1 Tax=Rhodopila sp. TaxID=2480087 RepID=UPI003D0BB1B5